MAENPFVNIYSKLPDKDVLHAIEFPRDYDPLAVEAARLEFAKRNLKENEIDEIHFQMKADELDRKKIDNSFNSIGNLIKASLRWIFFRWVIARKQNPKAFYILLISGIFIVTIYLARLRSGIEDLRYCLHFDSPCSLNYFLTVNLYFILLSISVIMLISLRKAGWFAVVYLFSFVLPGAAQSLISIIDMETDQFAGIYPQNKQTVIILNIAALVIGATIIAAYSTESVRRQFKVSRYSPFIAFIISTLCGLAIFRAYDEMNSIILIGVFLVVYLGWFFAISRKFPHKEVAVISAMDHLLFTDDSPAITSTVSDNQQFDEIYELLADLLHRKFSKSKRRIMLEKIEAICISKQSAINLLDGYSHKFQRDMIQDLCSLNSNYELIRENVIVFINYELAGKEFPHWRIPSN